MNPITGPTREPNAQARRAGAEVPLGCGVDRVGREGATN